ncbi:MAG: GIY-YIG nuclease family protein [Patescibacteria group bacterium]
MYNVYVLRSTKNKKRYVGYTKKSPKIRLYEHNNGSNKWTRQNGPFWLMYYEKFKTKEEAAKRERFLKSGVGRKWLDNKNF